MKRLMVDRIPGIEAVSSLADGTHLLENAKPQYLDNLLWSNSGYKPTASFQMVYTYNSILLKYKVSEQCFKADYRQDNEPVYEDSCVEFFLSFNNENAYYNFEFNATGTLLAAFGNTRVNRKPLSQTAIAQIKRYTSLPPYFDPATITDWELLLEIPFVVFVHHQIYSLQGIACKGNFYKCGDALAQPHFLSWSPIDNFEPDFHLPGFFGEIVFV